MAHAARKRATWEDLLAAPEGGSTEVVGGEIVTRARPLARHSRVQRALGRFVGGPFDDDEEPGGWWILLEPDVRLDVHDIVEPDLAGWRRERMIELAESRPIEIVPDWICEVLSPSNHRHDRLLKMPLYLRSGVPHAWLVDPDARTLEAYEARDGAWVLLGVWGDGDRAAIRPFHAVTLDVGRLFTPRPPDR